MNLVKKELLPIRDNKPFKLTKIQSSPLMYCKSLTLKALYFNLYAKGTHACAFGLRLSRIWPYTHCFGRHSSDNAYAVHLQPRNVIPLSLNANSNIHNSKSEKYDTKPTLSCDASNDISSVRPLCNENYSCRIVCSITLLDHPQATVLVHFQSSEVMKMEKHCNIVEHRNNFGAGVRMRTLTKNDFMTAQKIWMLNCLFIHNILQRFLLEMLWAALYMIGKLKFHGWKANCRARHELV